MPTPGPRPRPFVYSPMAFHERTGLVVVLVDRVLAAGHEDDRRRYRAETWLYDV